VSEEFEILTILDGAEPSVWKRLEARAGVRARNGSDNVRVATAV
jgi:hypothetical protein